MKTNKILLIACRIFLGLAFVFSGVTKGVDPMGWAILLGEYIGVYGLDFLRGSEYFFAIASSTLELTLGLLLVCGVWRRVTASAALAIMLFFSGLTLHIALTDPVADCGCFGEAVKLSNWQTFWKNAAILLPLSTITCLSAWRKAQRCRGGLRAVLIAIAGVTIGVGMGLWALCHLPIVDFLPYKTGIDLLAAPEPTGETTLIYRNIETGQQHEFPLSDTTWWDESTWEYVDTILPDEAGGGAESFAILDRGSDVTRELLSGPGELYLLCISDIDAMPEPVEAALGQAAAGRRAIALTPVPLRPGQTFDGVPYYNMDDTTLKSLLRADYGLVILEQGVIKKKYRWSDIPD